MELRLLTTFLKVAQLQSFSKAAESLGYSQSAVTVQVQQLENELGVRLFDRIGKTVSITHYGQEFIPYARDVVSAAARAVSFTVQERDLTGTLRIGTIESIMTASFGEILPLYHEHCPHVNTQLVEGDTKTLSDMLMHNEVDLIYTLDDMGYDAQRVKLFECPQEIVIVASPKHPFAAAKQLKLADLVNEPFVLMPQFNSYRHQFDMELAHQKLSIRPFLELESTSMVMQLLEHNPYLSVLPRYTARAARKRAGSSFCRSRTATWSSGASWCITATRCSRRRSAPWSPALRRWKKYRCISRTDAAQMHTKNSPHHSMRAVCVCEQKLSRSRTAGGRSDALS